MPKTNILGELSRYNTGTFAHIIHRHALLQPDQEAFVYGSERITFSEYNARVNSLIHALQAMGVKKGDTIGILSWNCLEYVELYGATMKGGFIASPFNTRLKEHELEYIINYSEVNSLFIGPELIEMVNQLRPRLPKVKNFISLEASVADMTYHRDLLTSYSQDEPDVQVDEDDPVGIIYTSGTTGVPRGALYTHRGFIDDSTTLVMNMNLYPGHRRILITPLFHIAGNAHFRSTLYIGGAMLS